ncbi:hypothetical protein GCM10010420_40900 [Streptomyces glaucosporus]|uniref:PknH-like extracellular domain-containing protein n=1 Tax=Streptomyces glaucosporus TaxID=284044 RepID=A0ABN3ILL9_9ACTN
MNTSTRTGRIAAAVASLSAAVAALAATTTAATASGSPAFLSPEELPPHSSSAWYAGEVAGGVPDPLPFCYGQALPGATSRYREFWTEYDTGATQVTVVERDEASARSLAALLSDAIRRCAERTEQEDPEATAEFRSYGRLRVEEGARVYGVHTAHSWGAVDVHLFSVGRDDRTVTVVHWGQMGTFRDAPVADFRRTTVTAVNKLH